MRERLKPNADGELVVQWSRIRSFTKEATYGEAAAQRGLYIIGFQLANPQRFHAVYVGQAGAGQYLGEDIQSRLQAHANDESIMGSERRGRLFYSRTMDIGDWPGQHILRAERYTWGRLRPTVGDNHHNWRMPITIPEGWVKYGS